ncbi:MAG: PD-(D/E)XK nuclease family protein, partial [Anaerolineales bacterium]|nr:PD-(D/E)XK nuclease family protein [Anaerolineales bacterium]
LLACPRAELTLLRPRFDESGALWVPSPYWDASLSLFPAFAPDELPLAPAPALERAASPTEVLNSAAATGATAVPARLTEPWAAAERALALERQRRSWAPPGPAEGILAAADITADLATRFGENHHWSASRLNRYGLCPYGFFAEHTLKLSELADPTEGFDAMQRGSLLHAILEELFRRLTAAGRRPEPESEEWLLTELEAICQQLFADAPRRYGFRESALWRYEQAELRRLLRLLVASECETGATTPREPLYQELRFGFADAELPPLILDVNGVRFQLHGVIDRIDRDEAGDLHIIDYKSGRTAYSVKDVAEGRSLQVVLYRRAVEELMPEAGPVAASYYLHLPNRETSGQPRANQVEEIN